MAKYATYLTASGTASARPVTGMFEVSDLPTDDFATRLADQVALIEVGQSYVQVTDASEFLDLDNDTNTYDYTVDARGAPDAPPPVAMVAVSAARYTLEQKQERVRRQRDILIESALTASGYDRFISDTDLGTYSTYISGLRSISDTEASPDSVVFPTLGAIAGASDRVYQRRYWRTNVIGSVGQTSGIPTGELFETATNANGLYYRTTDGFQVCRARIVPGYFNATRLATSWTFPAAFHSLSSYSFGATFSTHNNSNAAAGLADTVIRQCQVMSRGRSTTSIDIHVLSPTYSFVSGDVVWLDIWAIGRWLL